MRKTGQPMQPCVEIDGHMLVDVSGEELESFLVEQGHQPAGPDPRVPTDQSCTSEEHQAMTQAQSYPVDFTPRKAD